MNIGPTFTMMVSHLGAPVDEATHVVALEGTGVELHVSCLEKPLTDGIFSF